jgi:hypothetical protein
MLSALNKKYINYSMYIYVWEGFCPPYYFHGRAFVIQVIFKGGLLSALSFSMEGFCPPCHFHGRAFVREGFCPTLIMSRNIKIHEGDSVRRGFCLTFKKVKVITKRSWWQLYHLPDYYRDCNDREHIILLTMDIYAELLPLLIFVTLTLGVQKHSWARLSHKLVYHIWFR